MADLAQEYRKRHNLNSICLVNEGVLFFNDKEGKPALMCNTSTHSKASTVCENCKPDTSKLTVEIFLDEEIGGVNHQTIRHGHIEADGNLLEFIYLAMKDDSYVPYAAKSSRDQERWLWNFYVSSPIRLCGSEDNFETFRKTLPKKDPSNFISEMTWMAINNPSVMDIYYKRYYSIFLINRMYMLNG